MSPDHEQERREDEHLESEKVNSTNLSIEGLLNGDEAAVSTHSSKLREAKQISTGQIRSLDARRRAISPKQAVKTNSLS